MVAHIPFDPDFDETQAARSGTPPQVAFLMGVITAVGASAVLATAALLLWAFR